MTKKRWFLTRRCIAALTALCALMTLFGGCEVLAPTENNILTAPEHREITNTRTLIECEEPPLLMINGTKTIYETDKGSYFFTVNDDENWEVLTPSIEGYSVAYVTDFQKRKKTDFLKNNSGVTCIAYDKSSFFRFTVVFTTLPILSIETMQLPDHLKYFDDGEPYTVYYDEDENEIPYDPYELPPDDPDAPIGLYQTYLQMTLLDAKASEHGYENGMTSMARAHIRGRSSRKYPKSSYKLELLKEENGVLVENDLTLLGMRSDGDWNLNGMYAEPTKLRDKVAADLWLNITADREVQGISTGYRCEYVEIIINGRYHGLYLMTERIDRKQLELADGDRMYFSEGDVGKHYTDFLNCENEDLQVSGYSLDWPKERSEPYQEWVPFAEFTKLIDATIAENFDSKVPQMIDLDSLADYELFVQAATATDNLIQNTFYVARLQEDGSYMFEFLPWDLDQTFANHWSGEEPLYTYEDYESMVGYNAHFWVSDKVKARNTAGYRDLVEERYAALRKTVLSTQSLVTMVEEAHTQVVGSGAFMRNKTRWVDGGYASDSAQLIDYIERRMRYLDTVY